jgi:hypothetical protein
MKNYVLAFIIIIFFNFNETFSQDLNKEYIISPRIGSEIDKNEKAYFNLFPEINNFIDAKSYIDSNDSIFFDIKYDSLGIEKTQILYISKENSNNLKTAIENYEYFYSEDFINSPILKGYKAIPYRYLSILQRYDFMKNKIINILTFDGKMEKGKLIYSDSFFIVIANPDYIYNWKTVESSIKIFHYSELKKINNIGIVADLNDGNFVDFLSNFIEKQPFINIEENKYIVSPEIYRSLFPKISKYSNFKYPPISSSKDEVIPNINLPLINRFSIGTGLSFYSQTKDDIKMTFNYSWIKQTGKYGSEGGYFTIDVNSLKTNDKHAPEIYIDYSFLSIFSAGIFFEFQGQQENSSNKILNNILVNDFDSTYNSSLTLSNNVLGFYVSYKIIPYNPHKNTNYRNMELALSVGAVFNSINYNYSISFYNQIYRRYPTDQKQFPTSFSSDLKGLLLSFKYDYYLINYLSIYVKFDYDYFDNHIKETEYSYSYNVSKPFYTRSYGLLNLETNPSCYKLFWGLNFHF